MATTNGGSAWSAEFAALLVSGDDAQANKVVVDLITAFGFTAIDLGDLETGGRRAVPGSSGRSCKSAIEPTKVSRRAAIVVAASDACG